MSFLDVLNDDVVAIILTLLSPPDASRLAVVSRKAYTYAMPRVLSEVDLGSVGTIAARLRQELPVGAAQMFSFCSFMLSDAPRRLPYLKSLTIRRCAFLGYVPIPNESDSLVTMLVDILNGATNLAKLLVEGAHKLAKEPRLLDLMSIPSSPIQDITITEIPARALGNFTLLRPRKVTIRNIHPDEERELLSPFSHIPQTVEHLVILDPQGILDVYGFGASWPSVQILNIMSTIRASVLPAAFPNLRSLQLRSSVFLPEQDCILSDNTWQSLDYVNTDSTFAIPCHTRWLALDSHYSWQRNDLLPLLAMSSPVILSFWLDTPHITISLKPLLHNLKYLHVGWESDNFYGMSLAVSEQRTGAASWLTSRLQPFNGLSILGVSVYVSVLLGADAQDAVFSLASAVSACFSSVQYVGVLVDRYTWCPSGPSMAPEFNSADVELPYVWFRVVPCLEDGRSRLERLTAVEGRKAHRHLIAQPLES
ncbi:hypothetical protein POSPLADRAFT_1055284 [Postia placenta MAD-698-R-SB12]|uniref:F-box domain-containing protein n=1 Tax=Postia placenta MAD-698-R-SB12 TaxID=670580 RepID=A0A1X6N3L9_9APHY|nr:hypothetical protein POSPLADRAFT_1055284 [Postia placenta MAD-698-R-SB12]OSX63219.1 hypothetical protein POSPLADRAFT_1055284 [Postia placenta MAD-698-R-SB12]